MAKYISRRTVLQDIGRHGKKHCQNKFDNPQGSYQPKLDLMKQFRNQVDGFPVIKLNSGLIYCRMVNCQFKFKFSPESVVVWRRTPMLRWNRWRPSRSRSRWAPATWWIEAVPIFPGDFQERFNNSPRLCQPSTWIKADTAPCQVSDFIHPANPDDGISQEKYPRSQANLPTNSIQPLSTASRRQPCFPSWLDTGQSQFPDFHHFSISQFSLFSLLDPQPHSFLFTSIPPPFAKKNSFATVSLFSPSGSNFCLTFFLLFVRRLLPCF